MMLRYLSTPKPPASTAVTIRKFFFCHFFFGRSQINSSNQLDLRSNFIIQFATMPAQHISYSEKYQDEDYEYRCSLPIYLCQ